MCPPPRQAHAGMGTAPQNPPPEAGTWVGLCQACQSHTELRWESALTAPVRWRSLRESLPTSTCVYLTTWGCPLRLKSKTVKLSKV